VDASKRSRSHRALLLMLSCLPRVHAQSRSWEIPLGATAVEAACKIHSDIAAKFIVAEVSYLCSALICRLQCCFAAPCARLG
jgi:ribosome-binding ATPase YchF (GTP1/OBG family)